MGYTKARLQRVLDVYREARGLSTATATKLQRHLRNDYQFRRVQSATNLAHATIWDDDDASADEYSPETTKKRRHAAPKTPKAKRLKPDPQVANPTHTPPEATASVPTLVTLKFESGAGKLLLNHLAGQYGTGYAANCTDGNDNRKGGRRHLSRTYMEKQDEESGNIDEGTTRSGLKRKLDTPVKIQGCTACKQANKRCSAKVFCKLPCKRCQSEGVECVEYKSTEPTEVEDAETGDASAPPHTNVHPTPSPSPVGQRPIDQLRKHSVECQALLNPPGPGLSRNNPIVLDSPSPSPSPELAPKPFTFTIKTPWAHPIEFKHVETEDIPCHFCRDFRYGIYGYGLIEAEVYRLPGETQLYEAGDGHRANGKETTRMCIDCSLSRLHISRCGVHSLQRFGISEPRRFKKYIEQLLDDGYPKGPAIKRGVYYTCSLCTQPAFWRCVADQRFGKCRNKLSEEKGKGRGCGLLLCESCAGKLQIDDGILKKTTVQKVSGHDCRRADMGFLFPGSLLHKAYK